MFQNPTAWNTDTIYQIEYLILIHCSVFCDGTQLSPLIDYLLSVSHSYTENWKINQIVNQEIIGDLVRSEY